MAAEDLSDILDVFANCETVTAGNTVAADSLVIPFTDIPSWTQGNDGKELCFGLLQAVQAAVSGATSVTQMTVTSTQSTVDEDTLRKTFNFTVNVGFSLGDLDVEDEPA
jgi:hypothetical protein